MMLNPKFDRSSGLFPAQSNVGERMSERVLLKALGGTKFDSWFSFFSHVVKLFGYGSSN